MYGVKYVWLFCMYGMNFAMLIGDDEFIIIISFSVGGRSFRLRLRAEPAGRPATEGMPRREEAVEGSRKGQVSWSSADKNVEAAA